MKKTINALVAFMFISSVCFAQPVSSVNSPGPRPAGKIEIFTGKIIYVSLADPAKKTKTRIGIQDEKGEQHSFLVASRTEIYDKSGKQIAVDKIAKGDKVAVEYKFDSIKAKSIKIIP